MEHTLTELLKNIVTHPQDVVITQEEPRIGYIVFQITVNEEDKGIVIGKNGKNIKALGDIIAIKALKENKKAVLRLTD